MSKDKRVVVKGGGKNLYKISEYDGWFYAYQLLDELIFFTRDNSIGKTRTFGDALELIKSHSGREIDEIS